MSRTRSATSCIRSNRYRWFAEPASTQTDFAEATGQCRKGTTRCRVADRIRAESFLEQCAASSKVGRRAKESANCKVHRKGKPRKKEPRPARRRAGLRGDLLQHMIRNTRNTQIRSSKSEHLSDSKTLVLVLTLQNGLDFVGNTIILVSGHKVLAFSSRLEYESGG